MSLKHVLDKAGQEALKYCIDQGLAAWYLMTREDDSEYVEDGPYETLELAEKALTERNNRFKFYITFMFKDQAESIINYL